MVRRLWWSAALGCWTSDLIFLYGRSDFMVVWRKRLSDWERFFSMLGFFGVEVVVVDVGVLLLLRVVVDNARLGCGLMRDVFFFIFLS